MNVATTPVVPHIKHATRSARSADGDITLLCVTNCVHEFGKQIVDVFADRTRMNEVVKNSSTFGNFIDTLVHVIET
jgi:hypothetical protein